MVQVAIKVFQISADWLLLTFTTVQAIMELRSYKNELNEVNNLHDKRLIMDGKWWLFFPYKIYLEKKELKKVLSKSQSKEDITQIKRSKSFLLRSEAWLYIVLGSMFYLISTTIDISTSLIQLPTVLICLLPIIIIATALFSALRFLKIK